MSDNKMAELKVCCVLLTNQKHVKFLCSKKQFFQVTVNEINFLVEISSRWGLTQGLYPIRGPKIVQGPYVNEISNFSSSTVGNSSTFLSVLSKQCRPHWQKMDVLRNCPETLCQWNFVYLVQLSSRWGPTQGLYPIWGPKITQGLHANGISNFRSSPVYY